MLKKSVTFEDFNDEQQTEVLYFNLTRTEMMKMLDLEPRLEKWRNLKRDMTQDETLEFFEIIKDLVKASYGERSADGKRFNKSPKIFEDFESSAMYDAFLFGFIEHPESAIEFMIGILPKGIDDAAIATARASLAEIQNNTPQVVELPQPLIEDAVDMDTRPAWVKEDRDPTPTELQSMTKEEMQGAFRKRFTQA